MGHLPKLIESLALILMTAAITTILFKRIKQPLVLGYIIAGIVVGPFLTSTPTVADTETIRTLGEIGVIFLLFSLGLEFNIKKLMRLGGSASITGLFEISCMAVLGYSLATLLNWPLMDSLFLGGMMASSSTAIIIKSFDELGVRTQRFASIVFGVLVIEDIVLIMLMVLLSTIAITQQFEGAEMLFILLKLIFFLVIWFITGTFLIPTLLKRNKKFLDDETLLVLSTGLCLGMVVFATEVGFSAELGAFIMGSILAGTAKAEKIEQILKPVKNLFGAIFFVSVGMLIDPEAILQNWLAVILVTLAIIFGKSISVTTGALISGQPLKQSVKAGMSMSILGEFAFILAALGLSLNVTSSYLFPVAVGASAITTFTAPYMIRAAEPTYQFLLKYLPKKWILAIDRYSSSADKIQTESKWGKVIRSYGTMVITNGVVLLAIILITTSFFVPFVKSFIVNTTISNAVILIVSLSLGAPFLWAIMAKRPQHLSYKELWLDKTYSQGPLLLIEIGRNLLGIILISFWINKLVNTQISLFIIVPFIVLILVYFSKRIQKFYSLLERRFFTNLNAIELELPDNHSENTLQKQFNPHSALSPWDAHIIDLEVNPHADFIGKSLADLAWREQYGVNIAYIKRGDYMIYAPNRYNRLLPFDKVGIIATDEQMNDFKPVFDFVEPTDLPEPKIDEIIVQKIVVNDLNNLKGLSIRDSAIRERTNGLVVGIERKNERILNPASSTIFEWNDIVWIVGERKKILALNQKKSIK